MVVAVNNANSPGGSSDRPIAPRTTGCPRAGKGREALALLIGRNGFLLLDILDGISKPAAVRELLMAKTLRKVWRTHYGRDNGRPVEK
jgi:hypothetical protein